MSVQKRKIGYHSIVFSDGENHQFIIDLFCKLIGYIAGLSDAEKIIRDEKNHKAVSVDRISTVKKEGYDFIRIVFKSCKYNHNPNYMSSVDGSERPTSKQPFEGDKELTHMMMKLTGSEAYTIFEERRSGVTIGGVIKYLNQKLKEYYELNNMESHLFLWSGTIPPEGFLQSLEKTTRITVADLHFTKNVLGSEGLNLLEDTTEFNCREEVKLTLKSNPRDSLGTRLFRTLYSRIGGTETKLERIRLYGKDIDNLDITLDSLEKKKVQEIKVELCDNGTVDSYSIFAKMEEILGVRE